MDAQTHAQILALERMTTARLRQRYAEVFGEATLVQNKPWLVKRIAWRLQAKAEGELADDADLRLSPPKPRRETTTAETPAVARPAPATTAPAPVVAPAPAGRDP